MGDNIYTNYWDSILPQIIAQLDEGRTIINLPVKELSKFGDRKSYYASFTIDNGELEISKNAYAQGRDLYAALNASDYFRTNLLNSKIQVTISNDLNLKIEILPMAAPEFFTEEDFVELAKFSKQTRVGSNAEQTITYNKLKATYAKIEYWAKEVQNSMFPKGNIELRKRPTNQANNFESYQWAKIYPDKKAYNFKELAFTVGISVENVFETKIDIVGLNDSDSHRIEYLKLRGDFYHSKIVQLTPKQQVLDKGWKYLIDLTVNHILDLQPAYDTLLASLTGVKPANNLPIAKSKTAVNLNTILYGPPGTGKTYTTIDYALKVIDAKYYEENKSSRKALIKRFNDLLITDLDNSQGQIAFCTFHQSLSYEDFVEGIKPLEPNETDKFVTYKVVDGIFKKLCILASQEKSLSGFDESYDQFINDVIDNENVMRLKTPKMNKPFNIRINSNQNIRSITETEQATEMVVTKEMVRAYVIDGHIRDWKPYTVAISNYIKEKYPFSVGDSDNSKKNYVLIIDEINRGNVSQILGELITLIEDNKRHGDGNVEALSVIIPYSKKSFSVPSNLYLIGTMNTADRSVEALDTALRRRFSFVEMVPQENNIDIKAIGGIDLKIVLHDINMRLEKLLSRDHMIGHSYFLNIVKVAELYNAFYNKIIPQLQEYFFGDYGKIGLVLGEPFFEKNVDQAKFAKFEYDEQDILLEKKVYRLKNFKTEEGKIDEIGFMAAVGEIRNK